MKRIISFVLLNLQLCLSCSPQAFAAGPFIWGADNRAQGLQPSGAVFSNGQPIDYNGPINRIGNNEAIVDTSGWATYADAAAAAPTDCTGGSPNITWTRSTTTPLRGSANFLETKDAANRQGEGVAYAFSLDNADVNKTISVGFDVSPSANYVASDNAIYIYDITNATLITPASTSVGASNYSFITTFAASSSTSYRLCVHVASTNATAYTVKYDNFFVGPAQTISGTPTQTTTAYTPTGSWSANTTYTGLYARQGQFFLGSVKVATSGAPTSAALTINMPSGFTIDSTALTDTTAGIGSLLGDCTASDSGTAYRLQVKYSSSTAVAIAYQSATSGAESNVTQAAPFTFGAGDFVDCKFQVPIAEWVGSSAYTSLVIPEYAYNTNTADASNTTAFGYGAVGNQFGNFTAALDKRVRFLTQIQPLDRIEIQVTANSGVSWTPVGQAKIVVGYINQNANDYGMLWSPVNNTDIDVTFGKYATTGNTSFGGAGGAWSAIDLDNTYRWRVAKYPGGVQVSTAAQYVAARYHSSSTSISGSLATVVWTTADYDTNSAMSAGVFTCPLSGKYQVNVALAVSGTFALNTTTTLQIQKNSVAYSEQIVYAGGAITNAAPALSDSVDCLQGDTIRVQLASSATGPAIVSSGTRNFISIVRTGN